MLLAALRALGAGCSSGGRLNAPIACPTPSIPADAADLTRYAPGPVRDLTTLVFDARMVGLQGSCRAGRGNAVVMTVAASFTVERGAAAPGRRLDLPWSIAVLDGRTDQPLGPPRHFLDTVTFGPNETRVSVASQNVDIDLPVSEERGVRDYRILVYFQLSQEELALNRRRGPR